MGDRTSIEWTDATWSPVTGCSKVSPGCDNCYAERITQRWGQKFTDVILHPERLEQPLRWRKPRRIFVCSMSDLFQEAVPWDFLLEVFAMMYLSPKHTFQVLTKRPGRMAHFATEVLPNAVGYKFVGGWPSNIWAGTSVESPKYLPRLDVLARVPAKVRFVSVEPLLEAVDLKLWLRCSICRGRGNLDDGMDQGTTDFHSHRQSPCEFCHGKGREIDWVIAGGESGPKARPMHPDWVRSIQIQCQEAGVPFFLKQWGEWVSLNDAVKRNLPRVGNTYQFDDMHLAMTRVGKKAAGALLDGREWREMPDE